MIGIISRRIVWVNRNIVRQTMWTPDLTGRNPTRYVAIVEALAEAIATGALRPGDRLPTHRDLAWCLKVNVSTVSRAYAEATRRHLISGEVGRGTYVLSESREAALFALKEANDNSALRVIDLSTNIPAIDPAGTDLDSTLLEIARSGRLAAALDHPTPALIARIRATAASWIAARGLELRPTDIVPTAGAQQALLAVLLTVCNTGEPVLVEELTFPGIKALARQLGLPLHGVAMDAQGMMPEALDRVARATSARVVVLVPALQNPTGATMSEARRAGLAEVAERRDLQIIEDDVYGTLAATPPMAMLLPNRCTLVTSFSKSVAAGLRFGLIAGAGPAARAVAAEPQTTLWPLAPLMAEIACRWIEDGTALRRAKWQRDEVAVRHRLACRLLPNGRTVPSKPSPHAWLAVPPEMADPIAACRAVGVDVVSATTFAVTREAPARIRISLTAAETRAELGRALERLAAIGVTWPAISEM
ncbi:PLP-dependent aminotransferase family protein [Rhodopseudomonas sp. AAP120]|uniref:aminotransferase-like domain-containing protein n=1 Tax=Rhodopseudomonas sp. AAP120 TaxID=1523430 RepID=UPI001FDACA89|nr:PLP-dependent aminotransferase family protein [Rhodopseudomonas sp. AAP120]